MAGLRAIVGPVHPSSGGVCSRGSGLGAAVVGRGDGIKQCWVWQCFGAAAVADCCKINSGGG